MLVTIELQQGCYPKGALTREGIQRNIDAIDRANRGGVHEARDFILLVDTRSILQAIQNQLPPK